MPFGPKDWRNDPDATTPINAAALEDMEARVAAYADPQVVSQSPSSGSVVLDHSSGLFRRPNIIWIVTMTENAKVQPLAGAPAGQAVTAIIKQDATGSRVVSWGAILWEGGVTPPSSTAPNSIDVFSFFSDGTNHYGFPGGQGFAAA